MLGDIVSLSLSADAQHTRARPREKTPHVRPRDPQSTVDTIVVPLETLDTTLDRVNDLFDLTPDV